MSTRPIGIPCPTCLGRTCTQAGIPCSPCQATGWIIKPLDELTPDQARLLRHELREIPMDSDTAHDQDSTREHLTTTLTRRWIESVILPEGEATHIDLVGKRDTLRIEPSFFAGKFHHLTTTPVPPL